MWPPSFPAATYLAMKRTSTPCPSGPLLGAKLTDFDPVFSGTWISKHSSGRRISLAHENVSLRINTRAAYVKSVRTGKCDPPLVASLFVDSSGRHEIASPEGLCTVMNKTNVTAAARLRDRVGKVFARHAVPALQCIDAVLTNVQFLGDENHVGHVLLSRACRWKYGYGNCGSQDSCATRHAAYTNLKTLFAFWLSVVVVTPARVRTSPTESVIFTLEPDCAAAPLDIKVAKF